MAASDGTDKAIGYIGLAAAASPIVAGFIRDALKAGHAPLAIAARVEAILDDVDGVSADAARKLEGS